MSQISKRTLKIEDTLPFARATIRWFSATTRTRKFYANAIGGHSGLWLATYSSFCVTPSLKQCNLVKRHWCSSAGKVTAGLAESYGILPPGLWRKSVTCVLTAKRPRSARSATLVNPIRDYFTVPLPEIWRAKATYFGTFFQLDQTMPDGKG